jgi:hypothetical protein
MPTSDAAPAWGPWLITLLIYPGGLFALGLAGGIEVLREGVTALLAPRRGRPPLGAALTRPGHALGQWLRARRPARGAPSAWGPGGQAGLALAGIVAPGLALALMPLPGHPLLMGPGIAPVGDGLAVWALLLAGSAARGVLGLGTASVGAQLAGARHLRAVVLGSISATLALITLATAAHSVRLDTINAALAVPSAGLVSGGSALGLSLADGVARLVLLLTLPGVAGWPPADLAGVRPGPTPAESVLMGLPAPLPALVWVGSLLGRAAWAALAVLLLVPGSAAGGAGSDSAAWFAGALFVLVVGLAAWGARRLPPRPDQVLGIVWTLALPLALGALLLVVISR